MTPVEATADAHTEQQTKNQRKWQQTQRYGRPLFYSPVGTKIINEPNIEPIEQTKYHIVYLEKCYDEDYEYAIKEDPSLGIERKQHLSIENTIETFSKEDKAIEAIRSYINNNQPESPNKEPIQQHPEAATRLDFQSGGADIGAMADRIRAGSHIYIDGVAATITSKQDSTSNQEPNKTWKGLTTDDRTITVRVRGTRGKSTVYRFPDRKNDRWIQPQALYVTNEPNLRDSVDASTYRKIKQKEKVVLIDGDEENRFEVIEVGACRDGHINVNSGHYRQLDENDRRAKLYITHDVAERMCPYDDGKLAQGKYHVVNGIVTTINDPYGCKGYRTIDQINLPISSLNTATPDLSIPNVDDNLSRNAPITKLTGVGKKTSTKFFHQTVGELYDSGFPAPYISDQYIPELITDLYDIGNNSYADAIKAVVGILGGVAYDSDNQKIGSAASMITNSFNHDEIHHAWVDRKRKIKDKYTPTWITSDDGIEALGVGRFSVGDIDKLTNSKRSKCSIITLHQHPKRDVIGFVEGPISTSQQCAIEVPTKQLIVAATIAQVPSLSSEHTEIVMWPEKDKEGIISIKNKWSGYRTVIATQESSFLRD